MEQPQVFHGLTDFNSPYFRTAMENQIVNGRQAMIAAAGAYMRPLRKYSPQGHPLDLNAISFTFSKINPLKVKEGIDAAVNNFPM